MNSYAQTIDLGPCKYIRSEKEGHFFDKCASLYLFALYIMPQYWGILPNPVFDLTAVRTMIILLFALMIYDGKRGKRFLAMIKNEKLSVVILPYIIVLLYTMVLRTDLNAFLNPMIEIVELFLLIFVIKESLGVDRTYSILLGFIYILIILGFVEAAMQVSPFSYLKNMTGVYGGRYIRSGHYRVMSNCAHSLGYGLLLIAAMPFAGYDVRTKSYDVFRRPLLLFGIMTNIFLTGSRSSLGIMAVTFGLMFIMSDISLLRKNCVYLFFAICMFMLSVVVLRAFSIGDYLMLQITSLIDTFLGTQFSVKYGADYTYLMLSSTYRDYLKQVFKIDWLSPFVGLGRQIVFSAEIDGRPVSSLDNYYIAEFIRYAYPGMFSYIFFLLYVGVNMVRDLFRTRSGMIRMLFISFAGYCMHLYIADSLMTLKYLYISIALYLCCEKIVVVKAADECRYVGQRRIRYFK